MTLQSCRDDGDGVDGGGYHNSSDVAGESRRENDACDGGNMLRGFGDAGRRSF
jgi:hypothetical protein